MYVILNFLLSKEVLSLKKPQNTVVVMLLKIKGRLTVKNTISNCIVGLIVALTFGIVMAFLSRIIPLYNVYGKSIFIIGFALIVSLIYSMIKVPSL